MIHRESMQERTKVPTPPRNRLVLSQSKSELVCRYKQILRTLADKTEVPLKQITPFVRTEPGNLCYQPINGK